jgi:hypothetical protein
MQQQRKNNAKTVDTKTICKDNAKTVDTKTICKNSAKTICALCKNCWYKDNMQKQRKNNMQTLLIQKQYAKTTQKQ